MQGSRLAESPVARATGDPLNLMRVMPPQGAKTRKATRALLAWPFSFPMIAHKDSIEPHSTDQLPASTRVYVQGELFPEVRGAGRETALSPTKTMSGALEENEPVRVYDCSGP